jgi:hypothetical protein
MFPNYYYYYYFYKNQENKKLKFDIKMLEKKQIEILVFKEKVKRYNFFVLLNFVFCVFFYSMKLFFKK